MVAVLFLAVIFFLFDFSVHTQRQLQEELHAYLQDVRDQSAATLKTNMDFLTDELETEARYFSRMGPMTDREILDELRFFAQGNYVSRATIVTSDGRVYSSEDGLYTIDATPYLKVIEQDTLLIGKPRLWAKTGQYLIDISTPVFIDDVRLGCLSISYDRDNLQKLFGLSYLKGDCAISLVTSNGVVIGRMSERASPIAPGENYVTFHNSPRVKFSVGSYEELRSSFADHRSGWFECTIKDKPYFVSFTPTEINNWHVAVSATDMTLKAQARGFQQNAGLLAVKIVCILLLGALLFVWYSLLEWVNLGKLKDAYRLALKSSNDLFYEVDLEYDSFVDRSRRKNLLFQPDPNMHYSAFIQRCAQFCSPGDRQDFLDHFLPAHWVMPADGQGVLSTFEYRSITKAGSEYWYQCTVLPMQAKGDKMQKIICIGTDVTGQKRITANLQNAARRDGLTHLFNKVAVQQLIGDFLRNEGDQRQHALFVMDVDAFKHVNDRHGHAKGDEVITVFARTLSGCFRKSDILGRIGGDEFIALLKDYRDAEQVAAKAREMNDAIRAASYGTDEDGNPCTASISIGIALYPADGDSFDRLFSAADQALYDSKRAGKDRYSFYTAGKDPSKKEPEQKTLGEYL
ncbi:MAG: diguanylate cyclase [Pseudoflavonifractor sp.]